MNLFDVYPLFDITPVRAEGVYVFTEDNTRYLDLYGGHAVISIGHSHPQYVRALTEQLQRIGFYSNSVHVPIQQQLATQLGEMSGYADYDLFLINSGAEANENAIKLASFRTGRRKVIAFKDSFHGRTAAAVNVTDNSKLSAPVNDANFPVQFIALNDIQSVEDALKTKDVCAVIIEGIQGVGGLNSPTVEFLKQLASLCKQYGTMLILDEIQSGYGRTGTFFAHQAAGIRPDLITIAKGMGNGFPVGGVLISPEFEAKHGMLGTTFGGNHLACAAALAVLEVMKAEELMANAQTVGQQLKDALMEIPQITTIKGRGLMLGISFEGSAKPIRDKLLYEHHIFTGASSDPSQIRILPPLSITWNEVAPFISALKTILQ
ncbi:MAG: aminotransferase class III-fold pyridoxal phosphate-dependent enzyme [Flavobacteriales bacterium]|nr:aminotransferase class III-fold pyridoxal phosphate-dependent enzyme [Flavobacteriales bacterium]